MMNEPTMPDYSERVKHALNNYESHEIEEMFIYLLESAYSQGLWDAQEIEPLRGKDKNDN